MAKDDILDDNDLQYHLGMLQRHEVARKSELLTLQLEEVKGRIARDKEWQRQDAERNATDDKRFRRQLYVAALEGVLACPNDVNGDPDAEAAWAAPYIEAFFARCKRAEADDAQPGDPVAESAIEIPIDTQFVPASQEERSEHAVGDSDLAVSVSSPASSIDGPDDDTPF